MKPVAGWAVIKTPEFEILVNTVSETRRGAIVNWLHTEGGVHVLNSYDDLTIERIWNARTAEVLVVPVEIGERKTP